VSPREKSTNQKKQRGTDKAFKKKMVWKELLPNRHRKEFLYEKGITKTPVSLKRGGGQKEERPRRGRIGEEPSSITSSPSAVLQKKKGGQRLGENGKNG